MVIDAGGECFPVWKDIANALRLWAACRTDRKSVVLRCQSENSSFILSYAHQLEDRAIVSGLVRCFVNSKIALLNSGTVGFADAVNCLVSMD